MADSAPISIPTDIRTADLLAITKEMVGMFKYYKDRTTWVVNRTNEELSKEQFIALLKNSGFSESKFNSSQLTWWEEANAHLSEVFRGELEKSISSSHSETLGSQPDQGRITNLREQMDSAKEESAAEPFAGKNRLDESIARAKELARKNAALAEERQFSQQAAAPAAVETLAVAEPKTETPAVKPDEVPTRPADIVHSETLPDVPTPQPAPAKEVAAVSSEPTVHVVEPSQSHNENIQSGNASPVSSPNEPALFGVSVSSGVSNQQSQSAAPATQVAKEPTAGGSDHAAASPQVEKPKVKEIPPDLAAKQDEIAKELAVKKNITHEEALKIVQSVTAPPTTSTSTTESVAPASTSTGSRVINFTAPKKVENKVEEKHGSTDVRKQYRSKEMEETMKRLEQSRGTYKSPVSRVFGQFRNQLFGARYVPSGGAGAGELPGATGGAFEQFAPRGSTRSGGSLTNLRGRISDRFFSVGRTAATLEKGKKTAGAVVGAATTATEVAAAATGVGALAIVGKKVLTAVLTNPELRNKLKDIAAGAGILAFKALAFLSAHLFATGLGMAGFFVGGPVGFAAGFATGLALEGVAGSIGSFVGNLATSLTSASFGGLGASLATVFAGGVLPVLIGVGGTIVGTLFVIISTAVAFAAPPPPRADQQTPVSFKVIKKADKNAFPDYTVGPENLSYSIDIQAEQPITITKVVDKMVRYGPKDPTEGKIIVEKPLVSFSVPLTAGGDYSVKDTFTATGIEYKDSTLVNTVTVTVLIGTNSETKTAVEVVTFGRPAADQPYGFPLSGTIQDVDGQEITVNGRTYAHCGTFLYSGGIFPDGYRKCIEGGLDLSASGGTTVQSTLDGTVIAAGFDTGNGNRTTASGNPCPGVTDRFTCYAIGGYVYIQDKSKRFTVAYIHLAEDLQVSPGPVKRGQAIGTLYSGVLPTTTGPHVHMQVLLGGANFPFGPSVGACKDGKLLPIAVSTGVSVTAGPFACN